MQLTADKIEGYLPFTAKMVWKALPQATKQHITSKLNELLTLDEKSLNQGLQAIEKEYKIPAKSLYNFLKEWRKKAA